MTIHTRAATDEIYDIFNQPLKAEAEHRADSSDFEDDDSASVAESTETGRISVASSDFGDDETHTFQRSYDDETNYDDTQAGSVAGSEWTESTTSKDISAASPAVPSADTTTQDIEADPDESAAVKHGRERFIPEMPEDYDPPTGLYRDPEIMAQNRLPFMTPIVERTEHSLASAKTTRSNVYNSKTPSKPMLGTRTPSIPEVGDLLLSSPLSASTEHQDGSFAGDLILSPSAKKALSSSSEALPLSERKCQRDVIVKDAQCNPTDAGIRATIIQSLDPPLASFVGYRAHHEESNYAPEVQRFMKAANRRNKSGGESALEVPILKFPSAERKYSIRRELGAGAYAPVYLAESVQPVSDTDTTDEYSEENGRFLSQSNNPRYAFEAVKLEIGPPSAWEFYMIRTAHERIAQNPHLSRAADSIIRAHELHVFKTESFLIEDYHGHGTLLDLVNITRNESIATSGNGEGGLDEALVMFFTVELFRTIEALHACGILHGDIKPDNCLVRFDECAEPAPSSLIDVDEEDDDSTSCESDYSPRGAYGWKNKGLALIDFGRSIDMHAFDSSVQFIADWDPSTHECNEIREMRPWTHQIDLYGLAVTVHVLLFGKYLESTPTQGPKSPLQSTNAKTYRIRETLKRYWDRELWADVFDLLLNPAAERWANMEGGSGWNGLPVLNCMRSLRERMEGWLVVNAEKRGLASQIRKLEAVLGEKKRKLEKR